MKAVSRLKCTTGKVYWCTIDVFLTVLPSLCRVKRQKTAFMGCCEYTQKKAFQEQVLVPWLAAIAEHHQVLTGHMVTNIGAYND